MQIKQVDIYQVDLPVKNGPYRLSGGRIYTHYDATIAQVTCDDGRVGWGESTPFGGTYIAAHAGGTRAAIDVLAPGLIGQNPRKHNERWDCFDAVLSGHRDGRAALDIACWDLSAQAAGQPLCDHLGGGSATPVPMISSIGSDTPEKMREKVARHRANGFTAHSVKIGADMSEGGPALDAARLQEAMADQRPGEWFLADANGGMNVEHALRFLSLLPADLDFVLEAPCATWAETKRLRGACSRAILLDELIQTEADLILAISENLCDGVGLKISKQGGITAMQRQGHIAQAAGLTMSVQDTVGSEISFAAILHCAQATSRPLLRWALDTRAMVDLELATFDAPLKDGGARAPNTAGLGVIPHMDRLGTPIARYGAQT